MASVKLPHKKSACFDIHLLPAIFEGQKDGTFMIIFLKQNNAKINSERNMIFVARKLFSYFLYSCLMQWITIFSHSYQYCIQTKVKR